MFKDNYRLEKKYFSNIYTLLQMLRVLKADGNASEITKIDELLTNAIADNESIILIYKNLGELYSEIAARYDELGKALKDLHENLESFKTEINEKIDDVNNTLLVYINEINNTLDQIVERIVIIENKVDSLELENKSWSLPAEQLSYMEEEYKFTSCADIQNYNGRRGAALFTVIPAAYQHGLLYDIALYHDLYMNALLTGMPNGSAVTFFIRWEPYYTVLGYNTIGFREMITITKDADGQLSFAPVYNSNGEMEIWGKREFLRFLPSEERLRITYQFDIIWTGSISQTLIDNVIQNSIVLNIKN